jgi:hypothetical protein
MSSDRITRNVLSENIRNVWIAKLYEANAEAPPGQARLAADYPDKGVYAEAWNAVADYVMELEKSTLAKRAYQRALDRQISRIKNRVEGVKFPNGSEITFSSDDEKDPYT